MILRGIHVENWRCIRQLDLDNLSAGATNNRQSLLKRGARRRLCPLGKIHGCKADAQVAHLAVELRRVIEALPG